MNATDPQEKGELELLVDRVLGKERKWRRLTAVMYVLPFLLVIASAAYSGRLISDAETNKTRIEDEIKTKKGEITRLNDEIAQMNAQIDAAYDFAERLPQAQRESFDATIRASESPSKDAQAFVVIFTLPTLARARASAKRFTTATGQEVAIYKTSKGVYAVTLGQATTPDEARKRLDQAKTDLGKSDAYIRYSVDWIRQPSVAKVP